MHVGCLFKPPHKCSRERPTPARVWAPAVSTLSVAARQCAGEGPLAGSREGGGAARLPPSSSGPSPPGSWRDLCFSPVLRQKLPYECGSFPEPAAGETWEGTGSHPLGPPGSVLTVAQIDLVEDAGHFRSTVGPLWMRRVRGGWVGVCLRAGQSLLGPSKCGRPRGQACSLLYLSSQLVRERVVTVALVILV